MATPSSTHEHGTTLSSTMEPGQPPRRVKGVKVVPMYHPRMGYLHILTYAACTLVSPLPIEGPTASDYSEAHSVATPSPPSNWLPLPPITKHQETSSGSHRSISESDGVLAPLSTLTSPPLNERRLRSRDVKLPVRSPHPYKDSSYDSVALRSSKKTRPEVDLSQTESSKHPQISPATRRDEGNSTASRRPKRKPDQQPLAT